MRTVLSLPAYIVKNINLQIKKHKKIIFFHFYKKNIKNMHKNIKLQYPLK